MLCSLLSLGGPHTAVLLNARLAAVMNKRVKERLYQWFLSKTWNKLTFLKCPK